MSEFTAQQYAEALQGGTRCFMVEKARWDEQDRGNWYRMVESGEEFLGYRVGMMWFDIDLEENFRKKLGGCTYETGEPISYPFERFYHFGPDGHILNVVTPGGMWCIDSYCSNCPRREEQHSCWCRHGVVPNVTVDKNPNPGETTCAAGAGSIQVGDYHGFLRNGVLTAG